MAEQTCERCGGTGYVIVERDGFTGADRCHCFLDHIAEHRIPRAGIPEKFANASFDTFKIPDRVTNPIANQALVPIFMDIRRYAREYNPTWRKPGLLIIGSHGVGKTHLAIAAFREVLRRGFDGVYFDYQTLLDRIQAGWNREAGISEREAYQTAMDTPILLLDDIGERADVEGLADLVIEATLPAPAQARGPDDLAAPLGQPDRRVLVEVIAQPALRVVGGVAEQALLLDVELVAQAVRVGAIGLGLGDADLEFAHRWLPLLLARSFE